MGGGARGGNVRARGFEKGIWILESLGGKGRL